MPETTPLIKAALNLRGGAGFDVYGFIEMRLKNPFTYIGTKNRKNSHPKRKFFQKSFQKSFFTRNEKNDTA
jgi:hypothetical protein